ncbi:hypothetical protein BASA82_000601, partial [Batrachochytrium salamandrivorans]
MYLITTGKTPYSHSRGAPPLAKLMYTKMSKDQVLEVAREDFVLDDEPFAAGAMGDRLRFSPPALADLKREIHFLSTLRHPYVLELRGVCWGNSPPRGDHADGNVRHDVGAEGSFRFGRSNQTGGFWFGNVFGERASEMTGETGSYRYMAPEVFSHQSAYSYPVDVYSFGMLMYYLFAGIKPFYEVGNGVECARLALRGSRPVIQAVDTFEMRSVISSCWVHEPGYRPSISKVVAELVGLLEVATVSEHHRRKSL